MNRSEINQLQREAVEFFKQQKFYLPHWLYWQKHDWLKNKKNTTEIIENKLGWDLTDFGSGYFYQQGLLLITLRNGKPGVKSGKNYAEKIMIVRENQVTPWHFHWSKMEDIINRGGGNLVIELCNSTADETLADTQVSVQIDGITHTVDAYGTIVLKPGESITFPSYLYHQFYGETGKGQVLVGEVSQVNDDERDNRFLNPVGRFPEIIEDEAPLYYLCNEYPVSTV
ncbi:D-lyxose/D-mannose family sugar isomerase [candidate division KSB1 bacterium]|nr:D-lyxose/D-mannose family sugar isomerase [candidate division KSB1 bacterium]